MIKKTIYEAFDGKQFPSLPDCLAYERKLDKEYFERAEIVDLGCLGDATIDNSRYLAIKANNESDMELKLSVLKHRGVIANDPSEIIYDIRTAIEKYEPFDYSLPMVFEIKCDYIEPKGSLQLMFNAATRIFNNIMELYENYNFKGER